MQRQRLKKEDPKCLSPFHHPSRSILPPRTRAIRRPWPGALPSVPSCGMKVGRFKVWPPSRNGSLGPEKNTSTESSRSRPSGRTTRSSSQTGSPGISPAVPSTCGSSSCWAATSSFRWKSAHERRSRVGWPPGARYGRHPGDRRSGGRATARDRCEGPHHRSYDARQTLRRRSVRCGGCRPCRRLLDLGRGGVSLPRRRRNLRPFRWGLLGAGGGGVRMGRGPGRTEVGSPALFRVPPPPPPPAGGDFFGGGAPPPPVGAPPPPAGEEGGGRRGGRPRRAGRREIQGTSTLGAAASQ